MQKISIIVCGDFRAAHPEKIQLSTEFRSLLNNSDIAVCNFEAAVCSKEVKSIEKSGPSLKQSIDSPAKLKEMGFNVILLANNHIMDYGEIGLFSTLECFKDVTTVGAGMAEDAFKIRFVDVKGKRIGFLSLVQMEFGTVEGVEEYGVGSAWINSPDVPEIIMKGKRECDTLIVFPHAGVEHTAAPLPEWRRLYKHFIDWGADAVIATHPHCPQGWESYKGKPIYYSLGNFYFDELKYGDLWYKSLVVELNIGDTVEVKETFLCFNDETGLIEIDSGRRIKQYVDYANRLLNDEAAYMDYINNMCALRWPRIKYGILRGVCGVSLKIRFKYIIRLLGCMLQGNSDELFLLNAFQCESHRWSIKRYLRNK